MRVFIRKLTTASKFSWAEWNICGVAWCFILKVRLLLLLAPQKIVREALSENARHSISRNSPSYSLQDLHRLFRIAWRYQWRRPPGPNRTGAGRCLPTALAQQAFLCHYGFPIQFRIGVRTRDGKLEAHAWCEDPSQLHPQLQSSEDCFHAMRLPEEFLQQESR